MEQNLLLYIQTKWQKYIEHKPFQFYNYNVSEPVKVLIKD